MRGRRYGLPIDTNDVLAGGGILVAIVVAALIEPWLVAVVLGLVAAMFGMVRAR